MSIVIIDADDLDEFSAQLALFNRQLESQTSKLRDQFRKLGGTWRDPEYVKFGQEFEQTMKNLERFQRVADDVIPKLRSKAQRIRDVHR